MPRINATVAARRLRVVLGALLALNLIAAALVLYPPGGSAEDLERQLATLQSQRVKTRALVEQTRQHAAAVEKGRADGEQFLQDYFLGRRVAYAEVLAELGEAAQRARLKEREHAFATEFVEGSDSLSMMTITANYEGTYRELLNFIRELDQSPLLLIVESLNAAPQSGSNTLSVSMRIEAFVREEAGAVAPAGGGPIARLAEEAAR
jgi:hypothetical protein